MLVRLVVNTCVTLGAAHVYLPACIDIFCKVGGTEHLHARTHTRARTHTHTHKHKQTHNFYMSNIAFED